MQGANKPTYQELERRISELEKKIAGRKHLEQLWLELMDNLSDWYVLMDSKLIVVQINDSFLSSFFPAGTTRDQVLGKSFLELVPDLKQSGRYDKFIKVLETGEPYCEDEIITSTAGSERTFCINIRMIKIGDNLCGIATDITERKQAEETLRESERKYRFLVENLAFPLTVCDSDGHVLLLNRAGQESFGIAPEQVSNLTFYDIFPHNPEFYIERLRRVFESGQPAAFEDEIPLPTRKAWLYSDHHPLKDEKGNVIAVVVLSYDVTDRHQAMEALKESEERFKMIFENANDEIIYVDMGGYFVDVNDRVEDIFGWKRHECIGKHFLDFGVLGPEAVAENTRLIEDMLAGKPPRPIELEAARRDGAQIYVEVNARSIIKDNETKGFVVLIRDITERKQSEARWLHFLNAAADWYVLLDSELRVTEMNVAGLKAFFPPGTQYDDVIGRYFSDLVPDLKQSGRHEAFLQVLRSGESYLEDDVTACAPGSDRVFHINIRAVKIGERLCVIATDVTERILAQEALQKSEEKYRLVAENINGLIALVDKSGRYIYVNEAHKRIMGYAPEELLGTFAFDILHPEDRDHLLVAFMASEEAPPMIEVRCRHKDGSYGWFQIYGRLLTDENGAWERALAVANDITEQKRALEALRESEEKLRLVTENITDVIWIRDMDFKMMYVSPSVERMRGYTVEEMMTLPLEKFMPPKSLEGGMRLIAEGVDRERSGQGHPSDVYTYEGETYNKDGSIMWTEFRVRLIRDDSGRATAFLGVSSDITKRKLVEAELRKHREHLEELVSERTRDLEEANTALRVLLKKRDEEREEIEENLAVNVKQLVMPYFDVLKSDHLTGRQKQCLAMLQRNLAELMSPFVGKLASPYLGLTPTEIRVSDLIRQGKGTKEIAEQLHMSTKTVENHRLSIRKKLGLSDKRASLMNHLLSLK